MKRLLRALGITLSQTFSRRSTHLLCPSACGAKFDKAKEWNIPVVGMAWLEDMATEGNVPDVSEYLIGHIGNRVGKGKTKEDVHMIDITKGKGKSTITTFEVILIVPLLQQIQFPHYSQRNKISCLTSDHQPSLTLTMPLQPHSSPSLIALIVRQTLCHGVRTTIMGGPRPLHIHCHRRAALFHLNISQRPPLTTPRNLDCSPETSAQYPLWTETDAYLLQPRPLQ